MARPAKQGLSYFPIDVDFLRDIKTRKIMRACGAQSVSVLVDILISIYEKHGYWVAWDEDRAFLIADNLGVREGIVQEVVNMATKVGFFDTGIFEKYGVLTSVGIQRRYYQAISNFKRKGIQFDGDFALIPQLKEFPRLETEFPPEETPVSTGENPTDKIRLEKRRLEERREEETRAREEISPKNFSENSLSENLISEAAAFLGGMIGPSQYQTLKDFVESYSEDWILSAFRIAGERNKRTLQYARGILQSWKRQGHKDALTPEEDTAQFMAALDEPFDFSKVGAGL